MVLLARLDRVEHRGKDLVAVAQNVDAVAFGRGDADDAFDGPPNSSAVSATRRSGSRNASICVLASSLAKVTTIRPAGCRSGSPSGSECSTFSASCGLRIAGANRFELRADRAAEQHGDRREQ